MIQQPAGASLSLIHAHPREGRAVCSTATMTAPRLAMQACTPVNYLSSKADTVAAARPIIQYSGQTGRR